MKSQSFRKFIFVLFWAVVSGFLGLSAETIRILAIGNSFSEDAVENYLYDIAAADGTTLVIGNMYKAGCSLETHWQNASANTADYSYRKINEQGVKTTTGSFTIEQALTDENWDYITFQQVSQNSGMYSTYFPYLTDLIAYAKTKATNPEVKYALHATWAYQQNSDHSGFVNYDNDQIEMYDAIVEATSRILSEMQDISLVIPTGTAIQNARTSFVGDNFCRDGYHLDTGIGRYTAACTWYEKITGNSVIGNTSAPASLTPLKIEIAQTAARNAVQTPDAVTDMSGEYSLPDPATFMLASPVNIDFGATLSALPWNNISSPLSGTYIYGLLDMESKETPYKIEIIDRFGNINYNGPSAGLDLSEWSLPASATSDSFWGNAGNTFENMNITEASLLISNLNPAQQYNFQMLSSRTATDNREISFTVIGATEETVFVNGASNTTDIAKVENIAPKGDGTIKIVVTAGPNNNNGNKFYYLNAIQIAPGDEKQAVLEQSMYIDFGVESGATVNPVNGKYWNNFTNQNVSATGLSLVNATNENTPYQMQVIRKFTANANVGLASPQESELGDMAVENATKDFFFVEGTGNEITGALRIKNLDITKAYKFHVFGSREDTENRTALFAFKGLNIKTGLNQASGTAIGANGENQNTSNVLVSDYIFPDSKGEIVIEIARQSGSFAYLNAMKIEEYNDVPYPPYNMDQRYYFDFGHSTTVTESADVNGNYWNNITSNTVGTSFDLVSTANKTSGYALEIGGEFSLNDSSPGGLTGPNADLLGEMAIESASKDYLFVEGAAGKKGVVTIKNLKPEKGYKFYLFGSRDATGSRITNYTITGDVSNAGSLQTSGTNIGGSGVNRNTSSYFISDILQPDAEGKITIEVVRANDASGQFGYLGMMEMEEYALEGGIKATAINVSGEDITAPGQQSAFTATVVPSNATYPAIRWSVDNESVALIDMYGVLYPKANGTVTVTATIRYSDEEIISGTKTIAISNQLSEIYFAGSASEKGSEPANAIAMTMIPSKNGALTNQFELYTSLSAGTFNFYTTRDEQTAVVYGGSLSSIAEGGAAIDAGVTGPVRILLNLNTNTCAILPVTLNLTGSATPNGWSGTGGIDLTYRGDGVWSDQVTLNNGTVSDRARLNILLDKTWSYKFMKVKGTENKIMMESIASANGVALEDINTAISGGVFDIVVNLRDYTYSIECVDVNHYKISMMGSSVANGQGATDMKGYAYMYGELMQERYSASVSSNNWTVSGASINGNNTTNVLNRWDSDLIGDCSGYVIYGLSLGNEGIHDNGQAAFDSYRDNMQLLIQKARDAGKTPVVCNNYTRADFTAADYAYVKQMNLLMHEWDVPSINMLGAIDNGSGQWADGDQVQGDIYHPTTDGHREFFYAMVPSLFDALEANKPQPVRTTDVSYSLGKAGSNNRIELIPEETTHPFTFSFGIKTSGTGVVATFANTTGNGTLTIGANGKLTYSSPLTGSIESAGVVNDGQWYTVTLAHYYAQGRTILYVNDTKAGELSEKLTATKFYLSDANAPDEIDYRELFFYRSGMNQEEIEALNDGKMLKSSLEIYAPLGGENDPLRNLAQSTNTLTLKATGGAGIPDISSGDLYVYPNPVNDFLKFNGLDSEKAYSYTIFSVDGKSVKTGNLPAGQNMLNVSGLQSAYYMLQLEDAASKGKFVLNFIKVK